MNKKYILNLFFGILISFDCVYSQIIPPPPPDNSGINYQAIIRDSKGDIVRNKDIRILSAIIIGNEDTLYIETFDLSSNNYGLVNFIIGKGQRIKGTFKSLDWSKPYFILIGIDIEKNSKYTYSDLKPLMSVPYSLFSAKSAVSSAVTVMTDAQRDSILNPIIGMQILNITTGCFNYYNGISWFEICGNCVPQPTKADAGEDRLDIKDDITLAANKPVYGTGKWSIINGEGGDISDFSDPNAKFSGSSGVTYMLRWTISNSCSSTYDEVKISFCIPPTEAQAGNDQLAVIDIAQLAANTPLVGSGSWSIINGGSGTFSNSSSPSGTFTGIPDKSYTLRWTITTDNCGSSSDDIIIKFQDQPYFVEMIQVTGGTFSMGQPNATVGGVSVTDEQPVHTVTLNNYSIGKYEVSQKLWFNVMGSNPSEYAGCDSCPVDKISWNAAKDFITKLNQKTGLTYRFPTEAEWEYAARGGNKSKGTIFPGSAYMDSVGWYISNAGMKTHACGLKKPNELGIYDMAGNVAELCLDWYNSTYYSSSPQNNPTGPYDGNLKVLRGGEFEENWPYCRSFCRSYTSSAGEARRYYGLRLAL